ncbi:MAG: AAA family ATPase [Candidatus Cloacimonadota bacterium]|nr:MAG: AAA family ATPase [Candidatus Cloacimonadota bacterium]PIE81370.1 MAG: AAA family ATPase [Candidatus Delongbacteria bacterium]
MKKLGLGYQELSTLRRDNCVYVDKTKTINKLISTGKYYFLSRPRRFGKSLLVNTMKELFNGNKELFEGTWIYNKWNFEEKFPVIKISFANLPYNSLDLKEAIEKELNSIAKDNNVIFDSSEIFSEKFRELIIKLSKEKPVAILIDEYDKPIIDYITNLETAEKNREILKQFYSVIKDLDNHIKLLFITGVSKFSRVSFFSELNNLTDITIDENYAEIAGYTEKEIIDNYGDYLKTIEEKYGINRKRLIEVVKLWYNGYSWDIKSSIYNPYSVLSLLWYREFKNFWFKTGTATFLIKLIKEKGINVRDYDDLINVPESALDSYNLENINMSVLLFQTGYLTIKEKMMDPNNFSISYKIGYPNMEVKQSFYLLLGAEFAGIESGYYSQKIQDLVSSLEKNDIRAFILTLRSIFADIPNNLGTGKYESYYHTIIYLALKFMGINIDVEQKTNNGVIDAVVKVGDFIYVMEFKMNSAKSAIEQIKSKKYYEPYLNDKKKVVCMGIAFNEKDRNVKDHEVVSLEEILKEE